MSLPPPQRAAIKPWLMSPGQPRNWTVHTQVTPVTKSVSPQHTLSQLDAIYSSAPVTEPLASKKNLDSVFGRVVARMTDWVTSVEDRLFEAATVYRMRQISEHSGSSVAVAYTAEFERVRVVAREESKEWWWILYILMVALPHVTVILNFASITQVFLLWDSDNLDMPYLFLFFGSIGAIAATLYLASMVLDDLNPREWSKPVSRWHQVITSLIYLLIGVLALLDVPSLYSIYACLGVEFTYLGLLSTVIYFDKGLRPANVKTS